ncbi:MAG: DNA repair protein [Lachnospiraceae bacterium]
MCIDLKCFYASVECVERDLDPFTTNLVVADKERTEKTICLAISPAMKALGIHNRCRVFEIPRNVKYIMAPPRMKRYIEYSADIYAIYLKYVAKEDIHVYSIDEAFLDVTDYLKMYGMSAKELGQRIMEDVLKTTKITATCGIGTNLYLAKIALDITAKHVPDHIGMLDEESYRRTLWNHTPLTDFWRIGAGYVRRLASVGIYNMGQIAQADEKLLYRLFGVDAELLIDHAWGRETTTIADIKAYRPKVNSLSSGQVLGCDYSYEDCRLVVKEMADLLCLELVDKGLVTESVSLYLSYANRLEKEPAKGTIALNNATSSSRMIMAAVEKLYERIVDKQGYIHKVNMSFNNVVDETYMQYDLFTDPVELERERKMQEAMLHIKKKYGKNAILKGMDLQKGATTMERNRQIGGHKSGE